MGLTTLLIDTLLSTPYELGIVDRKTRSPVPKDAQGVEIELEFSKAKDWDDFKYWGTKADGSLRHHGIEFLFRKPLAETKELKEAFNEFEQALEGTRLINSLRTSTHVHHNVSDKTGLDIIAIFGVYWVVEDLLMDFCGESRKGNFNCLSNSMTQAAQETLENSLRTLSNNHTHKKNFYNTNSIYAFADNNYRYASLNPAAIRLFGSVEFRGMRELTTAKDLYRWSRIIQCLISYATDRPFDVTLRRFHRMTPREIVQDIFQDYAKNILAEASPEWEDNMTDALLAVQNLKNSLWTWNKEELIDFKKKCDASLEEEKKKNPEKYAGKTSYWKSTGTAPTTTWIDEIGPPPRRYERLETFSINKIPHHVSSEQHKDTVENFLEMNLSITPDRTTDYSFINAQELLRFQGMTLNHRELVWQRTTIANIPLDHTFRFLIAASLIRHGDLDVYYLQHKAPTEQEWSTLGLRFDHPVGNQIHPNGVVT